MVRAQPDPLEKFGRRVTHKKKVRPTPRDRGPAEPRRKKSHSTPTQSHQHRHTHKPKNTHTHTHKRTHARTRTPRRRPTHAHPRPTHHATAYTWGRQGKTPVHRQHTWYVLPDTRKQAQFNTHGVCWQTHAPRSSSTHMVCVGGRAQETPRVLGARELAQPCPDQHTWCVLADPLRKALRAPSTLNRARAWQRAGHTGGKRFSAHCRHHTSLSAAAAAHPLGPEPVDRGTRRFRTARAFSL